MNNQELYTQLYGQTLEAQKLTVALCSDYPRMTTKEIVILLGVIQSKLQMSSTTIDQLIASDLSQP